MAEETLLLLSQGPGCQARLSTVGGAETQVPLHLRSQGQGTAVKYTVKSVAVITVKLDCSVLGPSLESNSTIKPIRLSHLMSSSS